MRARARATCGLATGAAPSATRPSTPRAANVAFGWWSHDLGGFAPSTYPAHGFIDGDLIESFLDLPRTMMDHVAGEMGMDTEDISKMIEDIRLY